MPKFIFICISCVIIYGCASYKKTRAVSSLGPGWEHEIRAGELGIHLKKSIPLDNNNMRTEPVKCQLGNNKLEIRFALQSQSRTSQRSRAVKAKRVLSGTLSLVPKRSKNYASYPAHGGIGQGYASYPSSRAGAGFCSINFYTDKGAIVSAEVSGYYGRICPSPENFIYCLENGTFVDKRNRIFQKQRSSKYFEVPRERMIKMKYKPKEPAKEAQGIAI